MTRIGLLCVAALALGLASALIAAGPAAAGEINGHLYLDRNGSGRFDVGDDAGPPTILIFSRVVSTPGDFFMQAFVRTQPDGSYRIVVPAGRWAIRAPMIVPSMTTMTQILGDG